MVIVFFDLISLFASLIALFFLFTGAKCLIGRDIRFVLTGLLSFSLFYAFCLTIEWTGLSKELDRFEDFTGALLPMWWAFVFYSFLQQADTTDLKKSEENLRITLNSIGDGMIATNSKGYITRMNPVAEKLTGFIQSQALGKPLEEIFRIISAKNRQKVASPAAKVLTSGKVVDITRSTLLISKNGTEFHITDSAAPIFNDNGQIIGVVVVFKDVSDNVKMEEMMIQSEKMLSVGGLAAGMAHEINNPLAGMMQSAIVINDRLTNLNLPANLRVAEEVGCTIEMVAAFMEKRGIPRMLKNIRESGIRASEIVQNMLSFARKSNNEFSTHSMPALIDQTLELARTDYNLKKRYDFRSIKIIRDFEKDLPEILCEAGKIQQVIFNILRNGAEAMHTMSKKAPEKAKKPSFYLKLTHRKQENMLRIEIKDNGPGMNETTRKRIFEPFFTTKSTEGGTGLGLSISYFIITENHGGNMQVESAYGQGTTFILELPVRQKNNIS